MSSVDFDAIVWSTQNSTDAYKKLYDQDRRDNGAATVGIGSTDGLFHTINSPVLISEAEKLIPIQLELMEKGEAAAIGIWKPNAFKKHTVNIAVLIPGNEIPASNRFEAIENAIIAKAGLKDGEQATNIKIISETPKYVSTLAPATEKKTEYHIIGNGISANDVLRGATRGFATRTAAKAELKKILNRSRPTKFNLPVLESFEIIGITRVCTAKAELSKLAVRAKMDIVSVDATRPRDGWIFYGYGTM